jgi:hypothetical protein
MQDLAADLTTRTGCPARTLVVPPLWASPIVHGPLATMAQARAGHAASCARWAAAQFWPSSAGSNEIPFQFHFSLNFKISYLSVWSSKYYETGSVGFIILRYIHEKC